MSNAPLCPRCLKAYVRKEYDPPITVNYHGYSVLDSSVGDSVGIGTDGKPYLVPEPPLVIHWEWVQDCNCKYYPSDDEEGYCFHCSHCNPDRHNAD